MAASLIDFSLDDIKDVGSKTKIKLMNNGIDSVLDLAVSLPRKLEEILGGMRESANVFIISARRLLEESRLLEREFIAASEFMQKRKAMGRITTGSKNLDTLLRGGVATQAITEFYGDFGSGKTQIRPLYLHCQLPSERGGFGEATIYLDTEGTFRPGRIYQIAETMGLNAEEILQRIILCKIYNNYLEVIVGGLGDMRF